MVVHFPLALVLIATPLLFAARLLRNEALASTAAVVGTWNLCFGALAALLALATGLGATLDLDVGEAAHQAISLHTKWAMFTSLALILLAVWRGAGTAPGSAAEPPAGIVNEYPKTSLPVKERRTSAAAAENVLWPEKNSGKGGVTFPGI